MTIADTFRKIELTQSRNAKQELFLALLNDISSKSRSEAVRQRRRGVVASTIPIELDHALKDYVRVSIGLFAPRFDESFEVNIAEQLTTLAIAKSSDVSADRVKALVRQRGDFGDVAVELRKHA